MVTGMPNLLFTVLQHIIEDPAQLTQSMESTVKVCWLRLSKQKTSKVTFKSLIEILAPLVHRDQQIFVQVIRTNVRLYRSDGLLYTALKGSAQRSEEAAKSVTLDAAKGPVTQDASLLCSEEAIIEEKTKDDNKDIDREKDKEKEKDKDENEEVEQQLVKDEKNKTATVSTPKPATSSSSASSAKRQKTPQGYNSIPASTHTGVTLSSSTASSAVSAVNAGNAAVGIKTPSRSAYKEKRRKTMEIGTPHNITAPATTAQIVIEELLGLAVSQWSRQHAIANHYIATYDNGSKGEDGKPVKADPSTSSSRFSLPLAPCHLTIAEIMLVVGDLVSIVPGLATCVHR